MISAARSAMAEKTLEAVALGMHQYILFRNVNPMADFSARREGPPLKSKVRVLPWTSHTLPHGRKSWRSSIGR